MRTTLRRFVCSLLALACVALGSRAAEPVAFDWDAFRTGSAEQKVATVLMKIDSRDETLENIAYKARVTSVNVHKETGSRRFMHKESFEFRRLEETFWLHMTQYAFEDEHAKDPRSEWEVNCDGKAWRSLAVDGTVAVIAPVGESSSFPPLWSNLILGVRVESPFKPETLVQWLRRATEAAGAGDAAGNAYTTTVRAEAQNYKGVETLHLDLREDKFHREFWLDPARGFMIIATTYGYADRGGGAAYEVTAAQHVEGIGAAGVWVPKTIVGRQGPGFSEEQTELTYDVTDFRIGQLKEADVALPFPPDVKVYDRVRHIAYDPLPDGTFRLLPVEDERAGDRYTPTQRIVPKIDEMTPTLYNREHVGTIQEQIRAGRQGARP
jgi:hypothetical protein